MRVFFSWQSDSDNADGRSFIKNALQNAIKRTDEKYQLTYDEATRDESGSIDIIATVLKKIDEADIFIADVTLIYQFQNKNGKRKYSPNPNVVFELGYAMQRLGEKRVVMVCNEDHESKDNMPFDFRNRRILFFSSNKKKEFEEALLAAINSIVTQDPELPAHTEEKRRRDHEIASSIIKDEEFISKFKNQSERLLQQGGCKDSFYDFIDDWRGVIADPKNQHFDNMLKAKQDCLLSKIDEYRHVLSINLFKPNDSAELVFDYVFGIDVKAKNKGEYYQRIKKVASSTLEVESAYQEYRNDIHRILTL